MDRKQQLRSLGICRRRTLGRGRSVLIAVSCLQRDEVGIPVQSFHQSGSCGGSHIFFFHHTPCPRVGSSVSGIYHHPVRRVPHLWAVILCRDLRFLPLQNIS